MQVVDTFGLCSFSDPNRVLKEMQRVCKKGTALAMAPLLLEIKLIIHGWPMKMTKHESCCWSTDDLSDIGGSPNILTAARRSTSLTHYCFFSFTNSALSDT